MNDLTSAERELLSWLSEEDFNQYGECHGKTLDSLLAKGLARIHGPGEHQRFIANDFSGTKGMMYRAVSLTEAGWEEVKAMRVVNT
jgi:hypothetical protein